MSSRWEWRVKGVNMIQFVNDFGRQHSHGRANRSWLAGLGFRQMTTEWIDPKS